MLYFSYIDYMDISVCLIVKNEEEVIERCLRCASLFADEIVVVDTGSSDRTKELAGKFTDKIYDFVWQNDFAKARNFSFSKASCQYVMWLDADDVITEREAEKILSLKGRAQQADVYMLKYAISFDHDRPMFTYFRERILRRSLGFVWEGFIHEAISPRGSISYEDITIEHHKEKAGDPKRNLKIFRQHLKEGAKLSAREQYYYSKELYYNGYLKKAISET